MLHKSILYVSLRKFIAILALVVVALALFYAFAFKKEEATNIASEVKLKLSPARSARLIVVVDNNPGPEKLETAWGISIYVEVDSVRLLFDTGPSPELLKKNLEALGISIADINAVVISHEHGDHAGGLVAVAEAKPGATVYIPAGASSSLKERIEKLGLKPVGISKATVLAKGVAVTAPLRGPPYEIALLIVVEGKGLIVVTGCAHPGVDNIVMYAHNVTGLPVYAVVGGFHLIGASAHRLGEIAETFKKLGVKELYPIHCSGEEARQFFAKELGDAYKGGGVGAVIVIKS